MIPPGSSHHMGSRRVLGRDLLLLSSKTDTGYNALWTFVASDPPGSARNFDSVATRRGTSKASLTLPSHSSFPSSSYNKVTAHKTGGSNSPPCRATSMDRTRRRRMPSSTYWLTCSLSHLRLSRTTLSSPATRPRTGLTAGAWRTYELRLSA